jgi:carboxylesterase type B
MGKKIAMTGTLHSAMNASFIVAPAQQHLAAAMKTDWANLARTGSESPLTWPQFDPASQQVLSLTPPQPQVETSFSAEHQCAFWAQA